MFFFLRFSKFCGFLWSSTHRSWFLLTVHVRVVSMNISQIILWKSAKSSQVLLTISHLFFYDFLYKWSSVSFILFVYITEKRKSLTMRFNFSSFLGSSKRTSLKNFPRHPPPSPNVPQKMFADPLPLSE